jgi:hypothetical protein
MPPSFPEELEIRNVNVEDGDTIEYPGHPEVKNKVRFAGMDAHESGTAAGKEELEYLKTLIQGKTITLKIDPNNITDMYGRLLGVPFLGGVNVVHMMLAKFGKEILGTKYKNKYVNWDENTRIAKGEEAPGVPPGAEPPAPVKQVFKISIDSTPSNAKLHIDGTYTHHLTPSNEKELADVMQLLAPGMHKIKAVKAGKSAEQDVNITEGDNGRIVLVLEVVGLAKSREELEKEIAKLQETLAKLQVELAGLPA